MAYQVLSALAAAGPASGPDGAPLTMDQRRVDALMQLLRGAATAQPSPGPTPARSREVAVVLHVDTLFGDGPAALDPGQFRGLGQPVPLDAVTSASAARTELARGASLRVLLSDEAGRLQRTLRLGPTPAGGWTRALLREAVRAALPRLPELTTDGYRPTLAISDHVHARNPHCTGYDCPRLAARCDLDHDQPWPRGPTSAGNLHPRCRRDHELKTRGLVRTRLSPDGAVITRMLTGLLVTTRPAALPGYGPGEAYEAAGAARCRRDCA
jgi:hypothetical protein